MINSNKREWRNSFLNKFKYPEENVYVSAKNKEEYSAKDKLKAFADRNGRRNPVLIGSLSHSSAILHKSPIFGLVIRNKILQKGLWSFVCRKNSAGRRIPRTTPTKTWPIILSRQPYWPNKAWNVWRICIGAASASTAANGNLCKLTTTKCVKFHFWALVAGVWVTNATKTEMTPTK